MFTNLQFLMNNYMRLVKTWPINFHYFSILNWIIPLRAEQVSEANLRSEQGGINFTPFVLSLPNAKKKKKKKKKISIWIGVSSKMSVCCLLSVCLSVTSSPPIIFWTLGLIGLKFFFTKTRENVYLRILILKFRGQDPRVKAQG